MAKRGLSTKKAIAIFTPCITFVVAIMLVLCIAASMFWQDISLMLYGRAQTVDPAALADGYTLCEDIVEEGTVLLKNQKDSKGNPALPLTEEEIKSVNVFGWAAYDWMTMAFGSGYANTDLPKTKLFPALEEAGIEYNKDLYNLYESYYSNGVKVYGEQDKLEYRGGVSFGSEEIFVLREPSKDDYMKLENSIIACSSVGLVVIGRTGSESKDLELQQVRQTEFGKNTTKTFTDRHYLQLSPQEEDMIEVATSLCDKVIVILNTANTMETGFIDDEGIDGALLVGITGLSGVNGLINVLKGEKQAPIVERDSDGNPIYNDDGTPKYEMTTDADGNSVPLTETVKVSPSGRTADTYAYDILGTTPSAVNQGDKGNGEKGAGTIYADQTKADSRYRAYVDYSEGIYVGYKWFETADEEGFWSDKGGYENVVQFPFGYGLSYTEFTWTVTDVEVNGKDKTSGEVTAKDEIKIQIEVKNVGNYPGADVVELYYTAPYKSGEIEKASVNLVDFAKTGVIQPGETDIVVLNLTVQDMASYDCYDANNSGNTGYELDPGDYQLKLMKNSHEAGNMSDTAFNGAAAAVKGSVITYTVKNRIENITDSVTGTEVENRMTNKDGSIDLASNGVADQTVDKSDLDGSMEQTPVKYLSRADFAGTYPERIQTARNATATALETAHQQAPTQEQLEYAGYANAKRDTSAGNNGLMFSDLIGTQDFDDEIFDLVIANITDSELFGLISDGYFKTAEIKSIGKPELVDLDGPLGFNTRVTSPGGSTTCTFMAYPSGTMLAQTWNTNQAYAMGLSVGRERQSMDGLRGWYAPGANTHRNPFGGRNGEYYSEDGVLAGQICAGTVSGAKDMGVYSYVKHFVVNDSEYNREGLFTFLTEQALRETYLKPFEIMIKEGGGNALMTSMNRLGRVWSGANYGVMTEIVRNEWGFKGTAVTDWMNSNEDYMPPYRGIWAGNDIWLINGLTAPAFSNLKNETAYAIAEHVAKDVLWTYVDTTNAEVSYDPNAVAGGDVGAAYNMTWIAYLVLIEVAFAAGAGVMVFFLTRTILRNAKKTEEKSPETVSEINE